MLVWYIWWSTFAPRCTASWLWKSNCLEFSSSSSRGSRSSTDDISSLCFCQRAVYWEYQVFRSSKYGQPSLFSISNQSDAAGKSASIGSSVETRILPLSKWTVDVFRWHGRIYLDLEHYDRKCRIPPTSVFWCHSMFLLSSIQSPSGVWNRTKTFWRGFGSVVLSCLSASMGIHKPVTYSFYSNKQSTEWLPLYLNRRVYR